MLVDLRLQFHDHVWSVVRKAGRLAGELLRSTVCHSPYFYGVPVCVSYTTHYRFLF